jgi:hypothetical protein
MEKHGIICGIILIEILKVPDRRKGSLVCGSALTFKIAIAEFEKVDHKYNLKIFHIPPLNTRRHYTTLHKYYKI